MSPARYLSRSGRPITVEFRCPAISVNVISHHLWRQTHPRQGAGQVWRLDEACDEAIDQVEMSGITRRLEIEAPFGHVGIKIVSPTLVSALEAFEMVTIPVCADRKLCQVAERGQCIRQCPRHLPIVDVLDDLVPEHAPAFFPVRLFGIEPLALSASHTGIRLPEQCRAPEPHAQMQRMMAVVEAPEEGLPIPRPLEAVIAQRPLVLIDDPLQHEFLERHLPLSHWRR